MLYYSFIIIKK